MKMILLSQNTLLLLLLAVQQGFTASCSITEAEPPAECYGRQEEPVYIKVMTDTEVRSLDVRFNGNPSHKCGLMEGSSTSGSHKNFCHFNSNGTIQLDDLNKSNSGNYIFEVFDNDGRRIQTASMSLSIQEPVSHPLVSQLCLSTGEIKVSCSSSGDHPEYSWTLDYLPLNGTKAFLSNETQTVILKKGVSGSITCTVSNRVSESEITQELLQCPGTTTCCLITKAGLSPAECYGALGQPIYVHLRTDTNYNSLDVKLNFTTFFHHKKRGNRMIGLYKDHCHFSSDGTLRLDNLTKHHSGTYTFEVFDNDGRRIQMAIMSLTIQEPVSRPLVSQLCLSTGEIKASCSSSGDHLEYSWTLDYLPLTGKKAFFSYETQTVILKKGISGSITCTVSNRVSKNEITQELLKCPGPDDKPDRPRMMEFCLA